MYFSLVFTLYIVTCQWGGVSRRLVPLTLIKNVVLKKCLRIICALEKIAVTNVVKSVMGSYCPGRYIIFVTLTENEKTIKYNRLYYYQCIVNKR